MIISAKSIQLEMWSVPGKNHFFKIANLAKVKKFVLLVE